MNISFSNIIDNKNKIHAAEKAARFWDKKKMVKKEKVVKSKKTIGNSNQEKLF